VLVPDLATPAANAAVNAVTALIGFLSLHTTDPGTTGANEVTGGSYARQAITFGAASGGTATSTNGQTFTNMPAEAGNLWIGTWTLVSGGTYEWGGATAAVTGPIPAGASVVFAIGAVTGTAS
jgi:hypothetical protein